MIRLADLLARNKVWAQQRAAEDPAFFQRLVEQQKPRFFWLGCADSRVPANGIVDMDPGEMFVHRNIANIAAQSDLNFLSVLQYAVEVLEVEHIIVCGHYGCGGIHAALQKKPLGLLDNWLRYLRDIAQQHATELDALADGKQQADRLCELNVGAQVTNVAQTSVVQAAWRQGRRLIVNGWIYHLSDGVLRDLDVSLQSLDQIPPSHRLVD